MILCCRGSHGWSGPKLYNFFRQRREVQIASVSGSEHIIAAFMGSNSFELVQVRLNGSPL